MRKLLDTTAATIAMTVIVAMLLGFSLHQLVSSSLAYLGLTRETASISEDARIFELLPSRIASLLDLLNRVSEPEKQTVVTAARIPRFRIHLLNTPLAGLQLSFDPDTGLLRSRIEKAMTSPRPVILGRRLVTAGTPATPITGDTAHGLALETALLDGHWILLVTDTDLPPAADPKAVAFWRISSATWLALSLLLGIALSAIAARRLVRPLAQLATGVERTGGSGNEPPAQEFGPIEIRTAILAFNRMQERLRKYNDDRTRMFAAMSHDLRTPLTHLRLRLELIENQDQQRLLLAELDRMTRLIDSILLFARNDFGDEERMLVDITALVEGICDDAADAGEPVTFSGPRDIITMCRPLALQRAITNIVDNAVKYGEKALVTLSSEQNSVSITVEDEGPGIPRGERERVFEPFFRLEGSRNPDTGGVGLGLSVARSIVLEHGGNIALANGSGKELNVRLELPLRTA